MTISFDASREERKLAHEIALRAKRSGLLHGYSLVHAEMDLIATHANGCPMDFARLLSSDDFNFTHDFCGIKAKLDRGTGKLVDCFVPRFAKAES